MSNEGAISVFCRGVDFWACSLIPHERYATTTWNRLCSVAGSHLNSFRGRMRCRRPYTLKSDNILKQFSSRKGPSI